MTRTGGICVVMGIALSTLAGAGCGTTRMTDTSRSATEMLLVSQAIDCSVNQLDFTPMRGKKIFFEEKCLDGSTDKGYLISSLRSKMLADGCVLMEEKAKATYVVEARAGCVGTDRNSLLIGVPQMNLPSIMPGQPPAIPEMPLVKNTDQKGVAKIAVFAYNRLTGLAVWQSGTQESVSTSKNSWVLGTGPYSHGTVKNETDSTVAKLDVLGVMEKDTPKTAVNGTMAVTQAASFPEKPAMNGMIQQVIAVEPTKLTIPPSSVINLPPSMPTMQSSPAIGNH